MQRSMYPPCPLGVTDQALSDGQDGLLSSSEWQKLRAHVATCESCRQRAAGFSSTQHALRAQRIPHLQDRIWIGMQHRMRDAGHTQVARWSRAAIITGAVLAVVVVALFARIASQHAHPASITTTPTHVPTLAPTATPVPTAHAVTPDAAWGTAGAHLVQINAQFYKIDDLLPHAAGAIGVKYTNTSYQSPASVVLISYPSLAVRTLFANGIATNYAAATDGRYVAWVGGTNITGGPGDSNEVVGYEDLQTGQVRTLFSSVNGGYNLYPVVAHGLLFLPEEIGFTLHIIDLATGTQQMQFTGVQSFSVSWPYLYYANVTSNQSKQQFFTATLANLQTNQQTDISSIIAAQGGTGVGMQPPGVGNLLSSPTPVPLTAQANISAAIDGSTLFVVRPYARGKGLGIYEIDHADLPNPRLNLLFSLPILSPLPIQDGVTVADPRLLLLTGPGGYGDFNVWDREQQRLIAIPQVPSNFYFANPLLDNGTLGYWVVSGTSTTLVLRDEATLPKAPVQP